jgi:hypothetical protein
MLGAAQAARESYKYIDTIVSVINPIQAASSHPHTAKDGDFYYNTLDNNGYCYINREWIILSTSVSRSVSYDQPKLKVSPLLVNGRCSCCGAPDSTKIKCNYCQTVLRWYE